MVQIGRMKRGIDHLRHLEDLIYRADPPRAARLQPLQTCLLLFFAHVLKHMGCKRSVSESQAAVTYHLPNGLKDIVENDADERIVLMRNAITEFSRFSFGGNTNMSGKEVWSLVSDGKSLPKTFDELKEEHLAEGTDPPKCKKRYCSFVQDLLKYYGFEYLYKNPPDTQEPDPCPIMERQRKRRRHSVRNGKLFRDEGWKEFFSFMQFIAQGDVRETLRLRGFCTGD